MTQIHATDIPAALPPSPFDDFPAWLAQHEGRESALHAEHVNGAFARMLKAIGFDKHYTRAEAGYLWDDAGNKYIDFLTGWGVFALGRNHPKVKSMIRQYMDMDQPNLVRMSLSLLSGLVAEKLTSVTHEALSKVFFTNSGTEAVEAAIKFSRCNTGRNALVYCDHAFHGLTNGSLSVNGATFFKERFGNLIPDTRCVPFNDLAALEQALAKRDVAAFIVEPVQGKTCEVVADGYLEEAQRLCRKFGTLLVVDEIQSGMGRTGKWFCFQHWPNVEPDMVCVSKALSGGYVPVGALVTRPKLMDGVFNSLERCVVHSSTFGQNDMAMVAALATLHVMEDEKIVENAATLGAYAQSRLAKIGESCPFVKDVRGKGLMFGIDFHRPKEGLKLKAAWDMLHTLNFGVFGQMIVIPLMEKHRILTQVAGYHTEVIKFLPALVSTRQDIDYFLTAMDDVLADTLKVPGTAWDTVFGLAKRTLKA